MTDETTTYLIAFLTDGVRLTLTRESYTHDCWGKSERHREVLGYTFSIKEIEPLLENIAKYVKKVKSIETANKIKRIADLKDELARLESELNDTYSH